MIFVVVLFMVGLFVAFWLVDSRHDPVRRTVGRVQPARTAGMHLISVRCADGSAIEIPTAEGLRVLREEGELTPEGLAVLRELYRQRLLPEEHVQVMKVLL